MLNKFRRSIGKYRFFSITASLTVVGFIFLYLTRTGIADICFIIVSVFGLWICIKNSQEILRHGYYGIQLLPLVGIVMGLLLKQPEVSALLTVAISIETLFFNGARVSYHLKHSQFVKLLDTAVLPFTVLVFFIGGAMWTISGDASRFLSVVASASLAPLLFAAPKIISLGIAALKSEGILTKSVAVFERLAEAKSIVLKKSEVITNKSLNVASVETFGKHSKTEVITVAAALASESTHPASEAVVTYASSRHKFDRAKHSREIIGQGVIGRKKAVQLLIGRRSFLESYGIHVPIESQTKSAVFVATGDECIGAITFTENYLVSSKGLAKKLQSIGFKSIQLISGSNTGSTRASAKETGITNYSANMIATNIIGTVQDAAHHPTVFVSNNPHDDVVAPVSDISISAGTELPSATVEIRDYTIDKLLYTLTIPKKSIRKARLVVGGGLLLTLIFILIAASAKLNPLYAASVHVAMTLLVLVFSTDLRVKKLPR